MPKAHRASCSRFWAARAFWRFRQTRARLHAWWAPTRAAKWLSPSPSEQPGEGACAPERAKPARYTHNDAPTAPLLLECNSRPPSCALAKPLPALAHGDLLRPEDGQDRLCGVLGLHVPGEKTVAPLL